MFSVFFTKYKNELKQYRSFQYWLLHLNLHFLDLVSSVQALTIIHATQETCTSTLHFFRHGNYNAVVLNPGAVRQCQGCRQLSLFI